MEYQDFQFVDVATGGVQNRNQVYQVHKAVFTGQAECYRTYFRYPEEFRKHVEKTKSVKGYSGFAYSDWFPVDIDSSNLEEALKAARDFLMKIGLTFEVELRSLPIFFSGAKGFHVYLPSKMMGITPSKNIAQAYKKFAELLLTPWEIKYDPCIYDITRLFRITNTINAKTGLFKIPLTAEEIIDRDVAYITELAKTVRTGVTIEQAVQNQALTAIYKDAAEQANGKPKINGEPVELSQVMPKNTKLCYLSILKGVGQGQRDESAYRLACNFRKQGLTEDIVTGILRAWNQRNTPPMGERELISKVKSAYSSNARNDHGCNDPILSAHCDKSCYLLNKTQRNILDNGVVLTFDELILEYERYTQSLKTRLCRIDLPVIGPLMRGIAPGEVLTILARSGVGKTATILNLMLRIGVSNPVMPQLFFTLEQPAPQIFERMAQIACKLKGIEVEEIYSENTAALKKEVEGLTRRFFQNVLIVDKDFLTPADMTSIFKIAESKIGKKIGVMVIDYMGRMKGSEKSSYETLSANAQAVKHMAKELDVAVICAAQVGREKGGDGSLPLDMDSARDSGQVEEAADFVLGMWRPKLKANTEKDEDELIIKILKNRKGPQYQQVSMNFVKRFLRIDSYEKSFFDFNNEESRWEDNDDLPF
ncbi:MAG: DnaB-like helicase C-terminal domain-containing protein [Candidatus Xenobiia bacterium LiM19]